MLKGQCQKLLINRKCQKRLMFLQGVSEHLFLFSFNLIFSFRLSHYKPCKLICVSKVFFYEYEKFHYMYNRNVCLIFPDTTPDPSMTFHRITTTETYQFRKISHNLKWDKLAGDRVGHHFSHCREAIIRYSLNYLNKGIPIKYSFLNTTYSLGIKVNLLNFSRDIHEASREHLTV